MRKHSVWFFDMKSHHRNPLLYLFSKTWQYSKGNRKAITIYWSMFIIANIVDLLVNPFIWASILNLLQTSFNRGINRNDFDLLIVYLLCSVLLLKFF